MARIIVKLFGPPARLAGAGQLAVDVPDPATCRGVRERLAADVPGLRPVLANARLAVNHHFAADEAPVAATDEVALIGMVRGG
jgi:molybdopterin converting factor small subunit